MDPHTGDSPALRSHAAQVMEAADRIHQVELKLQHEIEASADLLGPAADAFRAGMAQRLVQLKTSVRELHEFADLLRQDT